MTAPDLDAIRRRFADYRDHQLHAMARQWSCCSAHEVADKAPAMVAEIERLRRELDTVERSDDARLEIVTAWAADAADVIRDLLRLSAVPADPPDEAIVRERAEALLAKVPPRPVPATDNDLTEVQ